VVVGDGSAGGSDDHHDYHVIDNNVISGILF
jgi:hypothetical protein